MGHLPGCGRHTDIFGTIIVIYWKNLFTINKLFLHPRSIKNDQHYRSCLCVNLECTIYSTIRETYLSRYYRVRPNMFKTVELFSSDKVKLLRNLAVYVYKAFELRQCLQNM